MMKNIARRGFTLIELLIVIVVIAVLSSMMILSSLEATYTAEANNIIVGFVQMKKAFDMWCMDHPDSFNKMLSEEKMWDFFGGIENRFKIDASTQFWQEVTSYIQKNPSESKEDHYYYKLTQYTFWVGQGKGGTEAKGLYIHFNINGKTLEKKRIAAKLAGRAKTVGLLNNATPNSPFYNGTSISDVMYSVLIQ